MICLSTGDTKNHSLVTEAVFQPIKVVYLFFLSIVPILSLVLFLFQSKALPYIVSISQTKL